MSPAATTPGAASRVSSHTTPLSSARPEPSSQPVAGVTPMPTTTTSASTTEPSAEPQPLDPVATLEGLDPDAEADVDPVVPVQVGAQRAQVGAHDALHGHGEGLDHGHLVALLATGRRHLGADEAGPDDDDPAGRRRRGRPGWPGSRPACAARGPRPGRRLPGRWRGEAPVAMTRPSKGMLRPSSRPRRRSVRSRPVARRPRSQSTSRSSTSTGQARLARASRRRPAPAWTAAGGRRALRSSASTTTTVPS